MRRLQARHRQAWLSWVRERPPFRSARAALSRQHRAPQHGALEHRGLRRWARQPPARQGLTRSPPPWQESSMHSLSSQGAGPRQPPPPRLPRHLPRHPCGRLMRYSRRPRRIPRARRCWMRLMRRCGRCREQTRRPRRPRKVLSGQQSCMGAMRGRGRRHEQMPRHCQRSLCPTRRPPRPGHTSLRSRWCSQVLRPAFQLLGRRPPSQWHHRCHCPPRSRRPCSRSPE
jgi:hypothetical protein